LRKLGLGKIERAGDFLRIGAAATLQELVSFNETPQKLKEAARFETNYNLRQTATTAGTLVTGDGKSAFIAALLALDAELVSQPDEKKVAIGNWLENRAGRKEGVLITSLIISLAVTLKYEFVGRSPQDLPVVSVAVGEWPTGRTRIVIGGFGAYPILAMDGKDLSALASAINNACSHLYTNQNSEYFLETAKTLARRLLEK
jgi:CO/xanthine dehydrogenase FAD-binding subunit